MKKRGLSYIERNAQKPEKLTVDQQVARAKAMTNGGQNTGHTVVAALREMGWKVEVQTADGYMMLDDIGGGYTTWKATRGKRTLYVFWTQEWWILDVSEKPISPSDFV